LTFDVAVVGAPFLDLTFEGLPRVPRVGEEVGARALHVGPGGTGMQAIGAARLGLSVALVAPLGATGWAGFLRQILESESVTIAGGDGPRPQDEHSFAGVPITALLSTPEGVAMATVLGDSEPRDADVAGAPARAVVLSIGRLAMAPPGGATYAVTGGLELPLVDDAALQRLGSAHALILNSFEVMTLARSDHPRDAALELARHVPVVVVTMGPNGALAVTEEQEVEAASPRVEVVDPTGAGDLFVSAYVWADLNGADLGERLAWACLYASLSVSAPTAFAGAVSLDTLLEEGASRGLRPPPHLGCTC
jgi:sugar/nucleoside kinase (ribokinase family)